LTTNDRRGCELCRCLRDSAITDANPVHLVARLAGDPCIDAVECDRHWICTDARELAKRPTTRRTRDRDGAFSSTTPVVRRARERPHNDALMRCERSKLAERGAHGCHDARWLAWWTRRVGNGWGSTCSSIGITERDTRAASADEDEREKKHDRGRLEHD